LLQLELLANVSY